MEDKKWLKIIEVMAEKIENLESEQYFNRARINSLECDLDKALSELSNLKFEKMEDVLDEAV